MPTTPKVYCIGETVFDIIFSQNIPVAAKPGGAMLNSAVSLGRAGVPVWLISDFAKDQPGDLIISFLQENGVSTGYISRYEGGQTALALAFLDEKQNAGYTFYRNFPDQRMTAGLPVAGRGDIVLFGSFYALTAAVRGKIIDFITQAKENGAMIVYDPNFRKAHLGELQSHLPWILENIGFADLVRGSDEDFLNIFGVSSAGDAFSKVHKAGCSALIYTESSSGVQLMIKDKITRYPVRKITPVSTIGAGDNFNAGVIYGMFRLGKSMDNCDGDEINHIINFGIEFASEVCLSYDNYISAETGSKLKNTL